MKYSNPILRGFYPDPSVCEYEGKYYMVCSTFQYFPGVPVFESDDLVNWKQTGNCLTRKSQIMLENINSSGGVFAPTIRCCNGRFYMVTTNDTLRRHFYVWTDDIHGEWSEPIYVDQDGIDPSLYFEDGRTYFLSNGEDDFGEGGIVQCEIDIETGKKLTASRVIWKGTGGRFLESPHMYKINGEYYLMAAEGGTEYGHMVTYARSRDIWGEFTPYPNNPVLTNRNKGGYLLQGMGHGDLVQDCHGDWHILHLGFRQTGQWSTYHHLGREVYMTPVYFGGDGWFTAGNDGTTEFEYEIKGDFVQERKNLYTFENTAWDMEWLYLRHPHEENYEFSDNSVTLHGTEVTLHEASSPTFIGIRQLDFNMELSADIKSDGGQAGITMYMDESHHYDIALEQTENGGFNAVLRLNIGDVKCVQKAVPVKDGNIRIIVRSDSYNYRFYVHEDGQETMLGQAQTRYLSSEVAGGFTGVVMGLYAVGDNTARFTDFRCEYK